MICYALKKTQLLYGFSVLPGQEGTPAIQFRIRSRVRFLLNEFRYLYDDRHNRIGDEVDYPFVCSRIVQVVFYLYKKTSGYDNPDEINENIILFAALAMYHALSCWVTGVRAHGKVKFFSAKIYGGEIRADEFRNHLADLDSGVQKSIKKFWDNNYPDPRIPISSIRDEVKYKIKTEAKKQQAIVQMIHLEEINVPEEVRQRNTEGLIGLMERRRKKEEEEDEMDAQEEESDSEEEAVRRVRPSQGNSQRLPLDNSQRLLQNNSPRLPQDNSQQLVPINSLRPTGTQKPLQRSTAQKQLVRRESQLTRLVEEDEEEDNNDEEEEEDEEELEYSEEEDYNDVDI